MDGCMETFVLVTEFSILQHTLMLHCRCWHHTCFLLPCLILLRYSLCSDSLYVMIPAVKPLSLCHFSQLLRSTACIAALGPVSRRPSRNYPRASSPAGASKQQPLEQLLLPPGEPFRETTKGGLSSNKLLLHQRLFDLTRQPSPKLPPHLPLHCSFWFCTSRAPASWATTSDSMWGA